MSHLQSLTFEKFQFDITLEWTRFQKSIDAATANPGILSAVEEILLSEILRDVPIRSRLSFESAIRQVLQHSGLRSNSSEPDSLETNYIVIDAEITSEKTLQLQARVRRELARKAGASTKGDWLTRQIRRIAGKDTDVSLETLLERLAVLVVTGDDDDDGIIEMGRKRITYRHKGKRKILGLAALKARFYRARVHNLRNRDRVN